MATGELVGAAVTGFVGGGLASLVAPWSTWGVEKRRARRQSRAALIERARAGLDAWAESAAVGVVRIPDDEVQRLMATPWYRELRTRLPAETRTKIEKTTTGSQQVAVQVIRGAVINSRTSRLNDAIADLEHRWKLT